jgi:hypothetical protein
MKVYLVKAWIDWRDKLPDSIKWDVRVNEITDRLPQPSEFSHYDGSSIEEREVIVG